MNAPGSPSSALATGAFDTDDQTLIGLASRPAELLNDVRRAFCHAAGAQAHTDSASRSLLLRHSPAAHRVQVLGTLQSCL